MAWVISIREARLVTVAVNGDAVGFRRGPVMTKTRRVVEDVPPEAWVRVLVHHQPTLPIRRGAGPCGTLARPCRCPLSFAWSIRELLTPLRLYYATYVPPMHFGAKSGPRGRKAA